MWFEIRKSIVTFFLHLMGCLPLRVHYFNSRWISFLIERVFKYRIWSVDDNLAHAFPEKSPQQRLEIRHEFYRHFTRIFLEALWFGTCKNPKKLRKASIVTVKNPELLKKLYDNSPSVMILSAHTGNWELTGGFIVYCAEKGIEFNEDVFVVVYRKLNNKLFDKIMIENRTAPIRDENFSGVLESRQVLRYILKNRDNKRIYDFITDQRPYFTKAEDKNLPKVNFMNRECSVMTASAEIACKGGMSVVYMRVMEERPGHYTMEFVPITENASGMDHMDIIHQYYKLLEDDIRKQPYNYLWSHNRWAW